MGAKTSVAESVFSLCFGVAWFGETSSAGSLDFCIFNIKDNMVKCYLGFEGMDIRRHHKS